MNRKTIVICTQNRFPFYDAGANYLYNFASIFNKDEYNIIFIGNSDFSKKNPLKIDGFDYISIKNFPGKTIIGCIFNHLFDKNHQMKLLFKNVKKPNLILLDSTFSKKQYEKIISHYSKSSAGCKFGIFVFEKYTVDENEKRNFYLKKIIKNNNNLIDYYSNTEYLIFAISSFLKEKFQSRFFSTMILPYIFSKEKSSEYQIKSIEHANFNILYSGIPSNKDDLEIVFKALVSLNDQTIKLNLIGVDEKWLKKRNKHLFEMVKTFVNFYGKRNNDFVLDMYSKSDFSILVRNPNKVFAKAGFPTKVSQSLACGVPVIANLTSDLGLYLSENNSVIIEKYDLESVIKAIKIARHMNKEDLHNLKINARKTSVEKLEITKYKNDIYDFLKI